MSTVTIREAQVALSQLVKAIESGAETEVVIVQNGKPAAKLVALAQDRKRPRIGVAKGLFVVPDDIDQDNEEIAKMFYGED